MNEEIMELLNSDNLEDVKLGVELLHLNREYKHYFIKRAPCVSSYVSIPLSKLKEQHIDDIKCGFDRYEEIDRYCRENNYWIYE